MGEGRRVGRALLRVLPLGLAVMAVNYAVDPAHVFGTGAYERRLAEILLEGHDAGGISNFDDRRLQQFMVAGRRGGSEVVALGSSRIMQIRAALFPGARFYNAAVSGGTLEDDIALYGLLTASGRAPSRILLGLDPWVLNGSAPPSPWSSLDRDYRAACGRLGLPAPPPVAASRAWERLFPLVSPSYFQASVQTLWARGGGNPALHVVTDDGDDGMIRRADGSLRYDRASRVRSPEEVRVLAAAYAAGRMAGLEGFRSIDGEAARRVGLFLHAVRRDGVEAVVVLPPFHPEAYRRLVASPPYAVVAAAEDALRRIAAAEGVRVAGSYDPARAGCGDGDFFDAIHPRETCWARVLAGR